MTYQDILLDLLKNTKGLSSDDYSELQTKAAKIYAEKCCEDIRMRCYKNATITENWHGGDPIAWVDDKSILNTEIILP